MSFRRDDLLLTGALGSLVILVYGPALGAGYYSDDFQWLGRMAPTLENPVYIFSVFYRDFNPLLHASFLLDYVMGRGRPEIFHATSLAVHAVCTMLLYHLCRRFTHRIWVAGAAALTWALNVRLSEAVIWPAARGHSLASLFVLAAVLCLGSDAPRRRWLAPPLFLLALLSKETALFPMLLAPLFAREPRRSRGLLGAIYLMAGAFVAFNLAIKPDLHLSQDGPAALLLKIPFILLRPLGLGGLYDFSYPMLALVLASFAALALVLRHPGVRVGSLWIAVCLVPIVPLGQLSSRYLYLLSMGYALALCGVCESVASRLPSAGGRRAVQALAPAGMAILVAANVLFISREIEDYDLLARPYEACIQALSEEARSAPAGTTFIVIDMSDRHAVPALNELIAERGGMIKLIPYRPRGVGGLIELPDILNIVAARSGVMAIEADPVPARDARVVVYDGWRARRAWALPEQPLPRERVLAARLAPSRQD